MVADIDDIDRRILFELHKNCRVPDTRLAKLVGRSKESVRYRIKKLQDAGILTGFTVWIDMTKFGYSLIKFYLTLANLPEARQEFFEFVQQDKRLFWFATAEGAWNTGLTYFVSSLHEFYDLKNDLFSRFHDIVLDIETSLLVEIQVKPRTHLVPADVDWVPMFDKPDHIRLDEIDKGVLRILFMNARTRLVDIAHQLDVSVDIVRNRMKRLYEKRIIHRYHAKINHVALGLEFFKTLLYFKAFTKKEERRLIEYARKVPQIIHLVKVIGGWDFELEIMCRDFHRYTEVINDLTQEFSGIIQKVETAIMSRDIVFPSETLLFEQ